MNISRYANIDKFVNIRYIFFTSPSGIQLIISASPKWKLLAPGVGLVVFLTPVVHCCFSINQNELKF